MISDLHHAYNKAVAHFTQQSSWARTTLHPVSCRSAEVVNDGLHPPHSSCQLRLAEVTSHAPLQRRGGRRVYKQIRKSSAWECFCKWRACSLLRGSQGHQSWKDFSQRQEPWPTPASQEKPDEKPGGKLMLRNMSGFFSP